MNEDSHLQDVLRSIRVTSAPPLGARVGIDSPIQESIAGRLGFSGVLDLDTTVGSTAITVGRSMRILGPIPGVVHDDRPGESPFSPVDLTFPQPEEEAVAEAGETAAAGRDTGRDRSQTDGPRDATADSDVSPDRPGMEPRQPPAPEPSDTGGEGGADEETAATGDVTATRPSAPPTAADRAWVIDELPSGTPEMGSAESYRGTDPRTGRATGGSRSTADRTVPGWADAGTAPETGPGQTADATDEAATPEPVQGSNVPFALTGHRPMSVTVSQGRSDLPIRGRGPSTGSVEGTWDRPELRAREQKVDADAGATDSGATTAERTPRPPGETDQREPSRSTGDEERTSPGSSTERVDDEGDAGTGTAAGSTPSSETTGSPHVGRDEESSETQSPPGGSSPASPGGARRVGAGVSTGPGDTGGHGLTPADLDRIASGVDVSTGAGPSPVGGRTGPASDEPGTTFLERLVTRSEPGGSAMAGGSGTVHRSLGASPPSMEHPEPASPAPDIGAGDAGSPTGSQAGRQPTVSGAGSRSEDDTAAGGIDRTPGTTGGVPPVDAAQAEGSAVDATSVDQTFGGAGRTEPSTSRARFPHLPHVGSIGGSPSAADSASLEYVSASSESSRTGQSASAGTAAHDQPTGGDVRSTGTAGQSTRRTGQRTSASTSEGTARDSTATGPLPISGSTDLADVAGSTVETETEWVPEQVPMRVATPVDRRVAGSDAGRASSPGSRPIETVTTTTVEPAGTTDRAGAAGEAAHRRSRALGSSGVAGSPDLAGGTPDSGPPRLRSVRRIMRQPAADRAEPASHPRSGSAGSPDAPDLEPVRRRSGEADLDAETDAETDAGTPEETVVTEETVEEVPPPEPATERAADAPADLDAGGSVSPTGGATPDMTVTDPNRLQPTPEPTGTDESGPSRRVVRKIRRRTQSGADAAGRSATGDGVPSAAGTRPRMTVTDPERMGLTGSQAGGAGDARRTLGEMRAGATSAGATAADAVDIDAPELAEIRGTGPSPGSADDATTGLPIALEPSGPGEVGTGVTRTEKLKHSQKSTTKEMPTLTVQSSTTNRPAPSEEAVEELREELRKANREAREAGGLELGGANAEIRERIEKSYQPQPVSPNEPSIEPELPGEVSSSRQESAGPTRGQRVDPDRAEAEKMYPDFTFKRPAPQVDATNEPEPRDITYREPETSVSDRTRDTGFERADVTDITEGPDEFAHSADLDRMIEKLQRKIERRRRIDRERRGL